ncbi:hypothetical protein DRF62_00255 [Chryseobacterium piscium]|uniref:Tetratricopeptide repeat protein n=1 Tax=Chryseobacterium piscium TaxID=333702 RepID=A0A3D9BV71_9FLAO|nr:hypothetical protein [Chryseobacterium piscium]REC57430.1 hypothetical protein DRF62_00255 [Chryseobacterium piscium]
MMNARVLELLKTPKNIQSEDLHLLKEEINSFPYIQNIRALHLYGVHLFDKENYQKELSTTAAYTTDKKILYQLINGKIQQKKIETLEKESQVVVDTTEENKTQNNKEPFWWVKEKKTFPKHDYKAVSENLASPKSEIKHVVVNGERNRILFEGEENYLEEKNADTIDLESTLESGVIVTQKSSFPIKRDVEAEKITNEIPSVETSNEIIQEEIIDSEKITETDVNVLETESFEPKTESLEEESVENENSAESIESEDVAEVAKSEAIITEDTIDSEKSTEIINDESEVSFLEVESFESEKEIQAEESIDNENSEENAEKEETTEVLNTEVIINEDEINSQDVAEKINDESELSFHGTDAFLPEVKIEAAVSEQINPAEITNSTINKHEDEMRRLIEEVEKKMKAAHKKEDDTKTNEPETENKGEISFAETQDFVVLNENEAEEKAEIIQEEISEKKNETPVLEEVKEENSVWKPMSIESHTPDSFSKKIEIEPVLQYEKPEEVKEVLEEIILEEEKSETVVENISEETVNEVENQEPEIADSKEKEEARVMNVSFFGTDISSLAIKKEEQQQQDSPKEKVEELPLKHEDLTLLDSNVPGFINTWQSWLKIDRTEEVEKVKIETKNKVIESFIENNPKISQLKEVVNFVVKEKTDDISHLMTETLANLYIEQKLYTKAINAFHTLAKKHPDRKEYFENKIQDIKDSRGKN